MNPAANTGITTSKTAMSIRVSVAFSMAHSVRELLVVLEDAEEPTCSGCRRGDRVRRGLVALRRDPHDMRIEADDKHAIGVVPDRVAGVLLPRARVRRCEMPRL